MNDKLNLDYGQLPPAFNPAKFDLSRGVSTAPGNNPDKDAVWMALRMLGTLNASADFATTRFALDNFPDMISEGNPLAKDVVSSPWTHAPWAAFSTVATDKIFNNLYKKDKFLGYLGMGLLNLLRGMAVINNFGYIDQAKRPPHGGYAGRR